MIGVQARLRLVEVQLTNAQQTIVTEEIGSGGLEAIAVLRGVAGFRRLCVELRPRLPVMCPVPDRPQQPAQQEDGQQD